MVELGCGRGEKKKKRDEYREEKEEESVGVKTKKMDLLLNQPEMSSHQVSFQQGGTNTASTRITGEF